MPTSKAAGRILLILTVTSFIVTGTGLLHSRTRVKVTFANLRLTITGGGINTTVPVPINGSGTVDEDACLAALAKAAGKYPDSVDDLWNNGVSGSDIVSKLMQKLRSRGYVKRGKIKNIRNVRITFYVYTDKKPEKKKRGYKKRRKR